MVARNNVSEVRELFLAVIRQRIGVSVKKELFILSCAECKQLQTVAGGWLECACEKCLCFGTMSGKTHSKEKDILTFLLVRCPVNMSNRF